MTTENLGSTPDPSSNKQIKYCPNCGNQALAQAVICVKCGYSFPEYYKPLSNKSAWSGLSMFLLIVGTLLIPFFGIIMGVVSLSTPTRRTQGISLLVLGIIRELVILIVIVLFLTAFYSVNTYHTYPYF